MSSHITRNRLILPFFLCALLLLQACQDEVALTSDTSQIMNALDTDGASISRAIEKIETAYKEGEIKVETGGSIELESQASPEVMAVVKSKLLAYQQVFESRYNETSDFSEAYPVGVIPLNDACPAGSTKIKFMMDNQDNGSSSNVWLDGILVFKCQ